MVEIGTAAPRSLARRRRGRVVIATATIVVGLAVALTVVVTHRAHRLTAADARRAGVPVVVGHTAYLADGTTKTLDLAADLKIAQLTVVPSYLVDVYAPGDPTASALRLVRFDGRTEQRPVPVIRDGDGPYRARGSQGSNEPMIRW